MSVLGKSISLKKIRFYFDLYFPSIYLLTEEKLFEKMRFSRLSTSLDRVHCYAITRPSVSQRKTDENNNKNSFIENNCFNISNQMMFSSIFFAKYNLINYEMIDEFYICLSLIINSKQEKSFITFHRNI